jgi:D-alanine--D-alanine ligase (EC 6.3.2.4)
VRDPAQLPEAMVNCFAYTDEALIERYVEGTEIAASVVQLDGPPRVLPLVEIVTEGPYDFDARYEPGAERVLRAGAPRRAHDASSPGRRRNGA